MSLPWPQNINAITPEYLNVADPWWSLISLQTLTSITTGCHSHHPWMSLPSAPRSSVPPHQIVTAITLGCVNVTDITWSCHSYHPRLSLPSTKILTTIIICCHQHLPFHTKLSLPSHEIVTAITAESYCHHPRLSLPSPQILTAIIICCHWHLPLQTKLSLPSH